MSASFLKLGQNPCMTSEKNVFFRTSCGDFVLALKMKPKFDCLTPQVMPELSIFSKCDMLQGCDMSHVTNILYFFCMIWSKYMQENTLHFGNNDLKQFLSILIFQFLRTVGLKYDLYLKVCHKEPPINVISKKTVKNCFKLIFSRCRILFYIYLDHIMQKNTNCMSHVTCHSPVTCRAGYSV